MTTQFQNDPAADVRPFRRRNGCGGRSPSGVVVALILIAVGLLLFLDNLGILHVGNLWQYWPVILIGAGLAKLYRSRDPFGWVVGFVQIGAGLLFLLSALNLFQLNAGMLWPLILVSVGVVLLTRRLVPQEAQTNFSPAVSDATLQDVAIFGSVKRALDTPNFLGGNLFALFGGIEIDLRRAAIAPGEPVSIDANAIFGGIVVRPPENCRIAMHGSGVFGGYEDKSLRSYPVDPSAPLLIITGAALFGGVSVE